MSRQWTHTFAYTPRKTRNGWVWLRRYWRSDDGYLFKSKPNDDLLDLVELTMKSYCSQIANSIMKPNALAYRLAKTRPEDRI